MKILKTNTSLLWLLVPLTLVACSTTDDVQGPLDQADLDSAGDQSIEFTGTLEETVELADHAEFVQVDRMGMPAIATAVITSKDAYNAATPTDDAAGTFVDEIVANVDGLHAALDDDLTGLGLVPCATNDCVNQAAPLVVPDVLTLDTSAPSGFPNGRLLTDPVIDVTLAVVLLDLSAPGQTATTLVGVNPTANDRNFRDRFPYLSRPHRVKKWGNSHDDDDDGDGRGWH